MLFFANLRINISNFIKKHKNKLIIGLILWIIVIAINYVFQNTKIELINTYEPHNPIFETDETVPEKLQDDITSLIDEYIEYCNSKEYEKAYNMITPECRNAIYPSIEDFKLYVNYVFKTNKIYNIQNYSNKNKKNIYRIRILDDILLTGLTNQSTVKYFEDKFVIEEKNGKLLLNVKGYIGTQSMQKVYEDKYMKIVINSKENTVDKEKYFLQITNRTDNYLIISGGNYDNEVSLSTNSGETRMYELQTIVVPPSSKLDEEISFVLFYDEGQVGTQLKFNKIRVIKNYMAEDSEENIVESYSTNIPLK